TRSPSSAGTTRDIVVSISRDHGATWEAPAVLESLTAPPAQPDKDAILADPRRPGVAYAVWVEYPVAENAQPSVDRVVFARTTDFTGDRRRWWSGRSRKHSCRPWRWPAMRPSGCSGSMFVISPLAARGSTPMSGSVPRAIAAPVGRSATRPARSTCVPRPVEASGRSSVTTWDWWGCLTASPRSSSRPGRKAATVPQMCSSRESRGRLQAKRIVGRGTTQLGRPGLEEDAMAGTETKVTTEQKRARLRKSYDLSARGDYEGSVQEGWADNGVFHSQMRGREFRGKAAITDEVKKQNQEV